jgi:hypothetical protein
MARRRRNPSVAKDIAEGAAIGAGAILLPSLVVGVAVTVIVLAVLVTHPNPAP